MTVTRPFVVILVALVALACVFAFYGQPAPAAVSRQEEPESKELLARIDELQALVPDQSHIMADVGEHFANLWFAGQAKNWPLADFFLAETRSHLRWAVRRIPVRKDNEGREVKLLPILEAFENAQLTQLKETIDRRDVRRFSVVYKEALTICYSCHKASDKPYLRPRVPDEPVNRIINFDPNAEWPQ